MSVKTNSVVALFFILVIILVIKPNFVYSINSSILGRLFLICLLIFFAMNNITLALLTLFIIIILLNKYDSFVEGMENIQTPDTIGEVVLRSTCSPAKCQLRPAFYPFHLLFSKI